MYAHPENSSNLSWTFQHQQTSLTYDHGTDWSTKLRTHSPPPKGCSRFLKPGTTFTWNDDMQSLFEESKSVIISDIEEGVRIFDASRPTCLATDWSKTGKGFWLFQKHCKCLGNNPFCCRDGWKITLAGSRFTHPAESRYAPVEGEALAVADALNKARYFVLGCNNLTLAVDHKPLLKIFGDRSLDEISNTRLRNLKEKTLGYRFRVIHIPGVKHRAADAISRHPTGEPVKMDLPDDVAPLQDGIISADLPTLAELRIGLETMLLFVYICQCNLVSSIQTATMAINVAIIDKIDPFP